MAQHYVSNKNESLRMFKSDFLEFFSHVHPLMPHAIYLPLMAFMLYQWAARPNDRRGRRIVCRWNPDLDSSRVHDAPLGFPL
jgi:hypothetical protein